MISYTKMNINIITFIISIIVFISVNSVFQIVEARVANQEVEVSKSQEEEVKKEEIEQVNTENAIQIQPVIQEWTIEIPVIGLKAQIEEGTTDEILNKYVGHFEETQKQNGNVGLAAHNRGYPVNYFSKVKNLKKGDEIYYRYNGEEKIYVVDTIKVIKDTDWNDLENTKEDKITLITCVEDAPMYRRCIQGIKK